MYNKAQDFRVKGYGPGI